jgi:hypothetical protein
VPNKGFLEKLAGAANTGAQLAQAGIATQAGLDRMRAETAQTKAQTKLMGNMGNALFPSAGTTQPRGGSPVGAQVDITKAAEMGRQAALRNQDYVDVPGTFGQAGVGEAPTVQRIPVAEIDDVNFQSGYQQGVLERNQAQTNAMLTARGADARATAEANAAAAKVAAKQAEQIEEGFVDILESTIFANPTLTFDQYVAQNGVPVGMDPESARRAFEQTLFDFQTALRGEENEFLYQRLQPRINSDALLKNAGNLKFAMSSLVSGYNQQNGFGDVAMIIGAVRLSDPGVSVRAEDVKTIEQALALLETYAPEMVSARMSEGDVLLPEARKRLYFQTLDLYEANRAQADATVAQIGREAVNALPNSADRIDAFLEVPRLPQVGSGSFGLQGRGMTPALRDYVQFEKLRRGLK